ncbi:MAG TPA: PP2C family protein-serine/threonine phosphatase [Candidatus Acidoferrales bacterium]
MAASQSPPGTTTPPPPPKAGARRFWHRVTDGLEMSELWAQFTQEARTGYSLYSREVDWDAAKQQKPVHRAWAVVRDFFWAMIMKLTPARRVLLLIALAALLLGDWRFTLEDGTAEINFRAIGILILLVLLALELADRVTMKRDLEIARDIQRWLVPAEPPQVEGVEIAFASRPANTVAGDYYDAFYRPPLPDAHGRERLMLVVADVAGKSVPAALLMATLQSSLHALAVAPTSLLELVHALNRYTCARSLGGLRFTTAFLAEFDPATQTLIYVCAGHNPPILRRVSGQVEHLETGGLPLGIDPQAVYEQGSAAMGKGDLLLVYTDGLIEAVNEKGSEYGLEALNELLNIVPGESAAETLRHLMEDVDRFVGRAPQHDDITCLVLRSKL